MKIQQKKSNKRRIALSTLLLISLILFALLLWWYTSNNQSSNQRNPESPVVNLEKSDSEKLAQKQLEENPSEKLTGQADTPTTPAINPSTGKQSVNVLLTTAGVIDGTVDARGYASDTVETSGTCTYRFTNTQSIVTKTTNPLPNPSSTTCETTRFGAEELSPGAWQVTLEFSSAASYGKSAPKEIIVP